MFAKKHHDEEVTMPTWERNTKFSEYPIMARTDDENSRDSGLGDDIDMNVDQPTDFSGQKVICELDDEMCDLAIASRSEPLNAQERETLAALSTVAATLKESKSSRFGRGLSDITNFSSLDEESPRSRLQSQDKFKRPTFARSYSTAISRKRVNETEAAYVKRQRADSIDEDEEVCTFVEVKETSIRRTSGSLQRVQSSSILERGDVYRADNVALSTVNFHLPHLMGREVDSEAYRRITSTTLHQLKTSMTQDEFLSKYILIDCRYPYEYNGGHIKDAINIYENKACEDLFFRRMTQKKKIPIFYCEFSQKRGPSLANHLRSIDRVRNKQNWPHVEFEEIYVLDKGYRNFFSCAENRIADLCEPSNYITMEDDNYAEELKKFHQHKKGSSMATENYKMAQTKSRTLLRQRSAIENSSPMARSVTTRRLFSVSSVQNTESPFDALDDRPSTPDDIILPPIQKPQFS